MLFGDIAKEIEDLGQQQQITADDILNLYQQLSNAVKQYTGKAAEECKIGNIGDFARLLAWQGGEFSRIYENNRTAVCEFKALFAKRLDEIKTQILDDAEKLKHIEQQEIELQQKQKEIHIYHTKIAAQTAELEQKKQELTQLETETAREREACEALKQEIDSIPVSKMEEVCAQKDELKRQLEQLKQQIAEQTDLQEQQRQLRQQIAARTAELEQKQQNFMQQKQLAEEEQKKCDGLAQQLSRLETIDLPAIQERRTQLEQQVEQLSLQMAEHTVACERETEKKQQAEGELAQLQTETSQMLADTEELLKQMEQLTDKKLSITHELQAKQTEFEQVKGEFSHLRAEYQQLLTDVQQRIFLNDQFRQEKLVQVQKDRAETEQKLHDMQQELQHSQDIQKDLIQRIDAARIQKSKLMEECDAMQISVDLAEKSTKEQQAELDRLTNLKLAAESAQKQAAEDCMGVQAKLEELQKQKPILKQKLDALTISLQNEQTEYENKQAEAQSRQNELSEMRDKQQTELDELNANIDRLKERSEKLQDNIAEAEKKLREWESDGEKKKSELQNLQNTLLELQNAMTSDEYQQQTIRLREIHSKLQFFSSKCRNLSEEGKVIAAQSGGQIAAFDVTADIRIALEETDAKLKQIGDRMNEYEKVVKEELS